MRRASEDAGSARHEVSEEKPLSTFRDLLSRPSLAAIGLAILVLLGSIALFELRHQTRVEELDQQYARSAAHLGRQLELQLEAYERVVGNLGPVALGGRPTTDASREANEAELRYRNATEAVQIESAAVAMASEAASRTTKQLEDTRKLLAQLKRKKTRTRDEKEKRAVALFNAVDEIASLQERLKDAEDAYRAQQEAVEAAAELVRDKAERTKSTAAELQREEGTLTPNDDGDEREPEARIVPDAQVESEGVEASRKPAAPMAEQHIEAEQEVIRAQSKLEQERLTEASKAKAVQKATQELEDAVANATGSAGELDDASEAEQRAKKQFEEWKRTYSVESQGAVATRKRLEGASERREEIKRNVDRLNAASATASLGMQRLRQRILAAAPPSYAGLLDRCFDSDAADGRWDPDAPATQLEEQRRTRCIFERLLEANDINPKMLRYRSCDEGRSGNGALTKSGQAFLSADRASIRFPILRDDALQQGCLSVSLEDMLEERDELPGSPWVDDERVAVAEVVLLGRDGKTLVSEGTSSIRIETLPGFDPDAALASSRLTDVDLGARQYRVYLQPVGTPMLRQCATQACNNETAEPSVELIVATLVPQDSFDSESVRMGPFAYLLASLVFALVVLVFPFAKLWAIGPRGYLTRFDVAALASASGLVGLIITVTAWSLISGARLSHHVDDQLEYVARALETELRSDFNEASRSLQAFEDRTRALQFEEASELPTSEVLADSKPKCDFSTWTACLPDALHANTNTGECSLARWPAFLRRTGDPWYCERTSYDYDDNVCGRQVARQFGDASDEDPDAQTSCVQAAWADEHGDQRLKYAADKHSAVPANVSRRAYFKNAIETADCDAALAWQEARGRLSDAEAMARRKAVAVQMGGLESDYDEALEEVEAARREVQRALEIYQVSSPIVAEVVRSASMLRSISIVARATCSKDALGQRVNGVAAVWSEPDVLERIVPPPGFEVAVVDARGRVMLHSDSGVYHGHVLSEDVDDEAELRTLIDSQINETINTKYLETRVRLHVRHVEGPQWTVLVMTPSESVGEDVLAMVVLTLLGCGSLFALELAGLAVLALLTRALGRERLRSQSGSPHPDARRSHLYLVGIAGIAVAVCCTVGGLQLWLGARTFWGGLILVVLVALAVWSIPRWPWLYALINRPCPLSKKGYGNKVRALIRPSLSTRYTLWYVGLACIFYVCPASLFYSASYERVATNRARAEQVHCVRAQQSADGRRVCVPMNATQTAPAAADTGGALAYVSPHEQTSQEEREDGSSMSHFVDLMPGYWLSQHLAGHQHRMEGNTAGDWDWSRRGDGLRLRRRGVDLVAELPQPLGLNLSTLQWVLTIISVILVAMFGLMILHRSLGRLFFLPILDRLERSSKPPSEVDPSDEDVDAYWETVKDRDEGHVLVGLAMHGLAPPHPRNTAAVNRLVRAGVLEHETLRIRNRELTTHIVQLHGNGKLPSNDSTGPWSRLRTPLVTGVGVALLALGASEPALGATGLLAPTLAAIIPALLRTLSVVGTIRRVP